MAQSSLPLHIQADDPKSLDEVAERVREDVSALLSETQETDVQELEYELLEIAGQWVPSNETVAAIYGERFFHLLLENVPQQRFQDYLENTGGQAPTPSRMLFEVVKEEIYERLKTMAQAMIDARFAEPAATPGPRERPSGLASPEAASAKSK